MRFSVGLWDSLFGKRSTVSVPMPDGTTRNVSATEKWWQRMIAEGKLAPVDMAGKVTVHHYDALTGYSVQLWTVGRDIPQESVDKYYDKASEALYVMALYKDDQSKVLVLERSKWEEWRNQIESA